jgi:glycosyltransferase involved in cell wall biosynthesis
MEMRTRFGFRPRDVVVAGIGRLIPVKGFTFLVEPLAKAASAMPALRPLLVGDGSERGALEAQATEVGIRERAIFTGSVQSHEIAAHLAAADVVAIPSIHHQGYVDGLPNVALEALAAGKPLVASRVGRLPDVVHDGESGFRVPERDVDTLAPAVEQLACDDGLRKRLGASGRRLARAELTWGAVGERLETVFERARL